MWLQLLERCASISSCQPAVVQHLGLQLVKQQNEIQGLHLQVTHQRAEAVELRGQVAALEGQLAQVLRALQHRV